MSKRIRVYSAEEVAKHNSASSCWITRAGKVYDVTAFLQDHPGGDDLILRHAGKDVEHIMRDLVEHEHSDSAYDMLQDYAIGKIRTKEMVGNNNWEATDDFHPEDTDTVKDFEENQFLDLGKPLLRQVWEAKFNKAYYLEQVHQPRHLPKSARLFGPEVLELATRTVWFVVPLFWGPIVMYLFLRSILQFTSPLPNFFAQPTLSLRALTTIPPDSVAKTVVCFFVGNITWTILEYGFHRFLFHVDDWLPDRPLFMTLHFMMHGVHHYMPMDRLRLVMPPALFFTLQLPFSRLAYIIFPTAVANGILSGAFAFYILYDCMHYALHHTRLPNYMREMKKYHLAHHYKNFELGFGVTSKIWDYVFNTVLPV